MTILSQPDDNSCGPTSLHAVYMKFVIEEGILSVQIHRKLNGDLSPDNIIKVYSQLSACLNNNTQMQ